jgi:uncharacterized protein YabE (DUF348 family)
MQRALALLALLLLPLQQQSPPSTLYLIEDGQIQAVPGGVTDPAALGLNLSPADRLIVDGIPYTPEQSLPPEARTVQIRRAVRLTLSTPNGEQTFESAAYTVGEALSDLGLELYRSDFISPPAGTPLTPGLEVTYHPARPLTVSVGDATLQVRSSAETVGQALAGAGIPLFGLDASHPAESAPLPDNGRIRLVRVRESILLVQKPIPFTSEFTASDELELDQQGLLQPGEVGLNMSRVRVRYEDGTEVSRQAEAETVVRPPQNRIVGYGTRVVVRTANVGEQTIEYWRAVRMYATSYSPCRSGSDRCYNYTASGKLVEKGVVAMVRANYNAMRGQGLYIPDYGYATLEDIGGGFPDGRLWIDLGFSDADYQVWTGWITVYFLTPVPANVLYILN